jgi:hypothetical protein
VRDGSAMDSDDIGRVDFPAGPDGRRSMSAAGQGIVADALRAADPAAADQAEREGHWRSGYIPYFRRLVEAGLTSPEAAAGIARAGLDSLYRRTSVVLEAVEDDGTVTEVLEPELDWLLTAAAARPLDTAEVSGTAPAARALEVPFRGGWLAGEELAAQLDDWQFAGVVEPSFATAVGEVARHPEWLALPGHTVAVLEAGAQLSPAGTLLSWGARVMAVDLRGPAVWERLIAQARGGAGTLVIPLGGPAGPVRPDLAVRAGVGLAEDVPAVADWLTAAPGPLVLGNYYYTEGHLRDVAMMDALTRRVQAGRGDVALAFLAPPTDVYAVPGEAVAQSAWAYAARPASERLAGGALRLASGGRLLRPAYPPGADPGISDSIVAQHGPNVALAKHVQRWRATVARRDGATVSLNIAPPTLTRAVLRDRPLAAAYSRAHRFGVEVFDPDTTRVLMAALLVHDVMALLPAAAHPWREEARAAAHGGLWRMAYAPRSALAPVAGLVSRGQVPGPL